MAVAGKDKPEFTEKELRELINPDSSIPIRVDSDTTIYASFKDMEYNFGYTVILKGKPYVLTKLRSGCIEITEL